METRSKAFICFGLGNPGSKYSETRHNVGFWVLNALRERFPERWPRWQRDQIGNQAVPAWHAHWSGKETEVHLLKPLTYMNLSGACVEGALSRWPTDSKRILVICDDVNLKLGQIRIRPQGSAGGQKGLQSVIDALGSDDFARLRIGVGADTKPNDMSDFVLSPFNAQEKVLAEEMATKAAEAVVVWFESGIEQAMNQFNASDNKK